MIYKFTLGLHAAEIFLFSGAAKNMAAPYRKMREKTEMERTPGRQKRPCSHGKRKLQNRLAEVGNLFQSPNF